MRREPGIVDVDDTVEEDQTKYVFDVDKQKAALNGVSTDEISRTMALALGGQAAGAAQIPYERTPVRIVLWFPRAERSSRVDLARIYVKGAGGKLVPLSEVGAWRTTIEDKTIYHRQLQRVVYVLGEMAGRPPVETILDMTADQVQGGQRGFVDMQAQPRPLNQRTMFRKGGGIPWAVPEGITVRWWDEGEMYITLHLFRDLAIAMLIALIAIYIVLMNQTGSYRLPLTIMRAIPLMVIGVMPGFWLLNQFGQHGIGGFMNPVFFSGPAFIGMIALAGIVTRNSIIIVDFIHLGLVRGLALEQAILESVAVRLRPDTADFRRRRTRRAAHHAGHGFRRHGVVAHLRADRLHAVFAVRDSRDLQRGLREKARPRLARAHPEETRRQPAAGAERILSRECGLNGALMTHG